MKINQGTGIGPRIIEVNDKLATLHPTQAEPVDYAEIDAIVERYRDLRPSEALVLILQDVQRQHRYIPEPAMRLIAERIGLPMVQVYGVATFYQDFSMQPRARYAINVCEGTSCYVRGADAIRRAIQQRLGIDYDEATADGTFGLARADYCYGCCQLGPVVEVNHRFYPHMSPEGVAALIDRLEREGEPADAWGHLDGHGHGHDHAGEDGHAAGHAQAVATAGGVAAEAAPHVDPTEPAPARRPVDGSRVGEDATTHENQPTAPPQPRAGNRVNRQIE